jgi:DeoR/GlpR family transcriptional regulator of sugar metabolism
MNASKIAERRRKVLTLLAKGFDQPSIALSLGVSQPTVHRDINALKKESRNYVDDVARYFGFYFQQTIQGIDEAMQESWVMYHNTKNEKIKLQALALTKDCCVARMNMIADGPTVIAVQKMGEKRAKAKANN